MHSSTRVTVAEAFSRKTNLIGNLSLAIARPRPPGKKF